jgi:hypothetical protein
VSGVFIACPFRVAGYDAWSWALFPLEQAFRRLFLLYIIAAKAAATGGQEFFRFSTESVPVPCPG